MELRGGDKVAIGVRAGIVAEAGWDGPRGQGGPSDWGGCRGLSSQDGQGGHRSQCI